MFQNLNVQTPSIPSTMVKKRRVHWKDGLALKTGAVSLEPITETMTVVATRHFTLINVFLHFHGKHAPFYTYRHTDISFLYFQELLNREAIL